MSRDNLLGVDRFDQHRHWRCSGWLAGDVDPIEPLTFVVERHGDRWLYADGDGVLIAVGDSARDLVAEAGGLERRPATAGFAVYLSAGLLRQVGSLRRTYLTSGEVVGEPRPSVRAGRPALDIDLRNAEYAMTLTVDDETGIWVGLSGDGLTITVERVESGASLPIPPALSALDFVPEVDLSHREPVHESLAPVLAAVRDASGLAVEVLGQDEQTGTFRFLLLDADRQPWGLLTRGPSEGPCPRPVFSAFTATFGSDQWSGYLDTGEVDHAWAVRVMRAVHGVPPLGWETRGPGAGATYRQAVADEGLVNPPPELDGPDHP